MIQYAFLFLCLASCVVQGRVQEVTRNKTELSVAGGVEKLYVSGENNEVHISLATQQKVIEKIWNAIRNLEGRVSENGKNSSSTSKEIKNRVLHNAIAVKILKKRVSDAKNASTSAIEQLQKRLSAIEKKLSSPNTYDLRFPVTSVTDYVIYRPLPAMSAVTVCLWLKTTETTVSYMVSYAVSGGGANDNELVLSTESAGFYFRIGGSPKTTNVVGHDGRWHHICVTWENVAGAWTLYKDGRSAAKGTGFRKGHVIRSGGTLVLGQDQDTVGGSFDKTQSYVGYLTGVNIWRSALGASEISKLSAECGRGAGAEGDAFRWRDAIGGISGHVQVIQPSMCKTS